MCSSDLAQNDNLYFQDTAPTSTQFFLGDSAANENGQTHVAYLFAHNDGDGKFGPDADDDAIKCGVATISGDTTVDLGFEPQWVLYKNASANGNWTIIDSMRGWTADGAISALYPNTSGAESAGSGYEKLTSTGFVLQNYTNGHNYVYVAIRRGTAVPESATEVFAVSDRKNEIPSFPSGFPVDFLIGPRTINGADNNEVKTRLTSGGYLRTNTTGAETVSSQVANFAHNDGFFNFDGANANQYAWMWKRAPGFFDVVAYTGTNVAGLTINHNLGVVPEMIWVKNRSASEYWAVYHKDLNGGTNPSHYFLKLNDTNAETDYNEIWNDTEPTDTQFTVGQQGVVNGFEKNQIAYLFASLPGISKVGSYTGNGSTLNIDCGFTSGARFVLIKAVSTSGSWYVLDTARGIVAGNDPVLSLNTTDAEEAYDDLIDPYSAGFTLNGVGMVNANTVDYIFYAIA